MYTNAFLRFGLKTVSFKIIISTFIMRSINIFTPAMHCYCL